MKIEFVHRLAGAVVVYTYSMSKEVWETLKTQSEAELATNPLVRCRERYFYPQ